MSPASVEGAVARPAHPSLLSPVALRALLVVGVLAVSGSGILVRLAAAPVIALAFWRCLGGAAALTFAAWRSGAVPTRGDRLRLVASGAFLAVHFALFIGSLSFTSVASASLFATTSPLFVGLGSWAFLGAAPARRTWLGMAVAMAGAAVVGLADVVAGPGSGPQPPDPLLGNLMAFASAVAVTGYLLLGQQVRRRLPVSVYGTWVYGTAAALLLAVAVVARIPLAGYGGATWLAVVGMVVGPQLLGHTVFNTLLSHVPATTVAVTVLAEPVGAGILAFLVLDEVPAPLVVVGAPLVLAGVFLVATARAPAAVDLEPSG